MIVYGERVRLHMTMMMMMMMMMMMLHASEEVRSYQLVLPLGPRRFPVALRKQRSVMCASVHPRSFTRMP